MFLARFHYASLQLDAFYAPITQHSITNTLNSLPKNIYETYDGALSRLNPEQHVQAIRALTWVAFSQVPLSVMELAAAVPIDLSIVGSGDAVGIDTHFSNPLFTPEDAISDPWDVLHLLPGLHGIQRKSSTNGENDALDTVNNPGHIVVLTHFTLHEYLTSENIKKPATVNFALNETAANLQLAEVCLEYHVQLCHIGCCVDGNAGDVQYALGKYAATYGMRHAENVDRTSWPLSLRQLIQYVFQDVRYSFLSLKENSGYASHCIDDWPIHYAVEKGFFQVVNFLLDEKLADVNTKSEKGETPLVRGVINRNEEMVQLLLDRGADANATTEKGDSALSRAYSDRERNIFQALLSHKADFDAKNKSGEPLIHLVTRAKDTRTLRLLVDTGADVNSRTHSGETALHIACRTEDYYHLNVLAAYGANVDAATNFGETALHVMARAGDYQGIEYVLERGADVSLKTHSGETALHLAARSDETYSIKQLVDKGFEKGADINAVNNAGETALHLVARFGYFGDINYLLEHGADLSLRTHSGETALHMAARNTQGDNVELLLEKVVETGADINAINNAGETAMYIMVRTFAELG